MQIRLNKYLASIGVASRRKVEEMITQGRVQVNGKFISELGTKVDPIMDKILVDGEEIKEKNELVYLILNKPKGIVSTTDDEHNRTTVLDLIKSASKQRLYPVGRLDQDSSGLILLTNDGELTNYLTHPKFHIAKTYQALVTSPIKQMQLQQLRGGVVLKEGKTKVSQVKIINQNQRVSVLEIVLHEGKYRQIRRMCAKVRINLLELQRVAFGPILLSNLQPGEYRLLTDREVEQLKSF